MRESQEMVFDAHDKAFAFFRGTCTRGISDNMKTAAEAVLIGKERQYNRRFLQMCRRYLVHPLPVSAQFAAFSRSHNRLHCSNECHLRCLLFMILLNIMLNMAGSCKAFGNGRLCDAGLGRLWFWEERMQTTSKILLGMTSALALSTATPNFAKADELTLCWAAWDPANALVELSKDFTAQTGTQMKFEFVPWPNFADRMLNELNSGGKLCDLLIGDSQWLGGSAENGYYVKLNDFFDKEGIKMTDFADADGRRLFDLAEGHAELLGAAGHGRRQCLVLPQGLVRQA